MKSLNARFFLIGKNLPERYSSYIRFARTVKDQKFSYRVVSKYFDILVDKDDYIENERKSIVGYLHKLSNMAEEG